MQGINFAFKNYFRKYLPSYDKDKEKAKLVMINFLSGGMAGCASVSLTYPLDVVRFLVAADVGKDKMFNG